MPDIYLDTSALVKRYIQEPGTPAVDIIFDRAHDHAAVIVISIWNVGEALGVIDSKRQRGFLAERDFLIAVQKMTSEILELVRGGTMQVYPMRAELLTEAWIMVLAQHMYQADALQIATCKDSKSTILVTSDVVLRRASEGFGLRALDREKNEGDIQALFG